MISFNRVTGVSTWVWVTAAVGTLGFVSLVFGETAIRSDYDKDDYILYMATVIQNDGSKPGLTDDTATGTTSQAVRQGVGETSGIRFSRRSIGGSERWKEQKTAESDELLCHYRARP